MIMAHLIHHSKGKNKNKEEQKTTINTFLHNSVSKYLSQMYVCVCVGGG